MDKRKAVFWQIIDSAVFESEELKIAPHLSNLTGTGAPSDYDLYARFTKTAFQLAYPGTVSLMVSATVTGRIGRYLRRSFVARSA